MNLIDESSLDAAVEGKLSKEHYALFNKKFREDPEFREAYFRQSELDSLLRVRLEKEALRTGTVLQFPPRRRFYYYAGAIAAAVALVIGGTAYQFSGYKKTAQNDIAAAPANLRSSAINGLTLGSAGRVVRSLNADASGPFGKITLGSLLMPGLYTVKAGSLSLELDSGTVIHVEAPAQIGIENPFYAVLHEGNATAVVPEPAIGFVLKTPTARIEDFGTSFAVNVAPAGTTKMRVLQGEVEMSSLQKQAAPKKMFANAACEVAAGGEVRPIETASVAVPASLPLPPGTPARYVHWSFDNVDTAGNFLDTGRHAGNTQYTLRFENESDSASGSVAGHAGKAWNFDGKRCALVSNYPGIEKNTPRTVAFWIKIPPGAPLESSYSIVAWGIPQLPARKWQIARNAGTYPGEGVTGAIRTEFGHGFVVGSTDLRDGKWHHITALFLGEDGVRDVAESVRHYVDGRLEAVSAYKSQAIWTETVEMSNRAKILKFGQRLENDPDFFPGFQGTIDEMYIFDGALTPAQIYELYENGRPPEKILPVVSEAR